MASSTSGSPPAELDQLDEKKDPATVDVKPGADSGEAVDTTKARERKYSIVRRFFAFIFVWMINAAFVVLPGALDSLKQNRLTPEIVEVALRSVQNIPLLVFSCIFCLVGIVGTGVVSWKYAHDHDWLFHEFYRPVASGGLFGVLSTIVTVYAAHEGKFSPATIATLAVMGSIAVIFGLLALNSYRHVKRSKDPASASHGCC
ncbi:hypothetical protein BJV78DRAFT_1280067 [Lactifluus subvellereus]|nr:hypothetical protein BJV78DRAFT_1280067 [Lactifluus subvellereus]